MSKIKVLDEKISLADARKDVEKILEKKGWKSPSFLDRKLIYEPYYYFNYTATMEKDNVVEKVEIWHAIMDARKLLIDNSFLNKFDLKALKENEGKDFEQPKADKTVLKRIAAVKIAEKFLTKKDNVDIFEDVIFYCPFWKIELRLKINDKESYNFLVNAFTGEIKFPEIEERKESIGEIIQETMEELKEPKKWIEYSKGIASKTTKGISEKNPKTKINTKYDIIYLAIIVILLIILYIVLTI